MSDDPEEISSDGLKLSRRDFLQVSAASAVFAPTLLDEYSESLDNGPQSDRALSEEAANLRPPPTERRDYFPLAGELVSVRGLAPPQGENYPRIGTNADTAVARSALTPSQNDVWVDDDTLSLRNLAAWRSNSNLETVFDQAFPNSVRELITPQGTDLSVYPEATGWENWLGDFERGGAEKLNTDQRTELIRVIGKAVREGIRYRAVGSGHSHSEAAAPEEWFTDMKDVSGTLEQKWLRDPSDPFWDDRAEDESDVDASQNDSIDRDHLIRLGAGTVLRTLNREILADRDLGLPNMGAWDGQTLAGAINTSTHGTGLNLGTFADLVRSVEIVCVPESQYQDGTPYVRALRIEPSDGITDPTKFAQDADTHGMALIQNDDLFHSVVVGYGCMGIAYAYTLEMRDFYWLREETTLMSWNTLKDKMSPNGEETKAEAVRDFATKDDTRHLQFQVNLAAMQSPNKSLPFDDHRINENPICLVRRHYEVDKEDIPDEAPDNWKRNVKIWSEGTGIGTVNDPRWPPERRAREVQAAARAAGNRIHPLKPNKPRAKQLHNQYFHQRTEAPPFVGLKSDGSGRYETAWYIALRRLRDKNESTPQPPQNLATTTEVGVPLEDLVNAIDEVKNKVNDVTTEDLRTSGKFEDTHDVFFFPPMGVRFTAESDHFLSPEFKRPTAMIEVPFNVYMNNFNNNAVHAEWRQSNVPGRSDNIPNLNEKELRDYVAEPALELLEDPLVRKYNGRPHLGKHNSVNANSSKSYMRPQTMYPEYEKWLDAYRYLNAFGTFDGAFSDNKTP